MTAIPMHMAIDFLSFFSTNKILNNEAIIILLAINPPWHDPMRP
ncbi:MAG: hypothetical protein K0R80_3349 [Clostridia bacterium]|nr:hypothetical protein [Clostridia bacterium]